MITEVQLLDLITPTLEEKKYFVVTLEVRPGNNILIEIDSADGVKISDCVSVSKAIENNLDRENEDFELQVSSPGLDKPFKVIQQYEKNIGKDVQIQTLENKIEKGKLLSVNNENITVEIERKVKEGKKKKTIIENKVFNFNQIKETKIIISFK
ncbi:MAG: ribosome assembly cofactor RimP [Flavobacteriales bacterium CG18_big_fil_WC_8_21_14_2_50_32_9]|nr:MAG: ribosome assembly cofactor RimP [Flavobacteriales bacterium CG18_big_fil_WC_8_21_14_2_50_32_9]PJC61508.1 MAG: ribosome assembly cofactor RimP [Flavobacteriales bacterium CG_4_9_14_0_2_um_filter_32_27]